MEDKSTILFGWYNDDNREEFSELIEGRWYSVTSVGTLDTFNGNEGMLQLAERDEYDFYLMDANLGFPGEGKFEGVKQIYELIRERAERGEAKLYTFFSAWDNSSIPTVELKNLVGVVTMGKQKFIDDYIIGNRSF